MTETEQLRDELARLRVRVAELEQRLRVTPAPALPIYPGVLPVIPYTPPVITPFTCPTYTTPRFEITC